MTPTLPTFKALPSKRGHPPRQAQGATVRRNLLTPNRPPH
jgi:hypothetical protein